MRKQKEELLKEMEEEQKIQTLLYNTKVNQNMLIALSILYAILILTVIIVSIVGFFKLRHVETSVMSKVGDAAQRTIPGIISTAKSVARSLAKGAFKNLKNKGGV